MSKYEYNKDYFKKIDTSNARKIAEVEKMNINCRLNQ